MVNGNTFASVTFVPACEGGQAGTGGAVGVRGALGAVRCAPEVVRATFKKNFSWTEVLIRMEPIKLGQCCALN